MNRNLGLLRVGLVGVVWGSIPVFVRMVEASPLVIVFWRVAFASAAVFLYLVVSGKVGELSRLKPRTALALLALGALLAGNWALFFGAFALTRVAVVELLSYTGPVFVAAMAPLIGRERFDRRIVVPLVLALGGTALIIGLGRLSVHDGRSLWGALMAFCTAIIYAVLMLSGKRLLDSVSASVMAFCEYAFATVLLLPAALLLSGPSGLREWGALAVLGVVHTAVAILIFFSGLRMVRADHAAVFTYAEPVTAVVFAAIFLAEPLGWATGLGGAAVVAAGVLVARMSPSTGLESSGIVQPNIAGDDKARQAVDEIESSRTTDSGDSDRSQ
jgi:drug/metabolite transporter (DMT)-like permease